MNPVVHPELHTGDPPQARDLYAELCGWRPQWIETRARNAPGGNYPTASRAAFEE